MNFFSHKIPYTSDDLHLIVSKSLNDLKLSVGDDVYITSSKSAVVTHLQAKEDIEKKINGEGRTSIRLLSVDPDIDLNSEVVEKIVQEIESANWYLKPGDNIIFTVGEVKRLKELLISQINRDQFVNSIDFCSGNRIEIAFIKWLLTQINEYQLIIKDDIIVDEIMYNKLESELIEKLNKYSEVVSLQNVLDDITSISSIQYVLGSSINKLSKESTLINGSFDRQGVTFTPESYRLSLQNDIISKLKANGFINQDATSSIKDISKLIDEPIYTLSSFIIINKLIENIKSFINDELNNNEWFDLTQVPYPEDFDNKKDQTNLIELYILPTFTSKSYRIYNNRYLLSINLEKQLKKDLNLYYENLALNDGQTISSIPDVQQSDNAYDIKQSVLKNCKLPNNTDITSSLTTISTLPSPLLSLLISSTAYDKDVRTHYQTILIDQVTKNIQKIKSDAITKLSIYLNGIKTTSSDPKLQTKLTTELIEYASTNLKVLNIDSTITTTLQDLETILLTSSSPTSPIDLLPTKQKLLSTMESQLKKASDPALILHLSVIIYHGRTISTNPPGLLKTTGKNVPKILNLLQTSSPSPSPILTSFTDLKTAITSKQPKSELKQLADQVRNLLF